MPADWREEFAKLIVEHVGDRAIGDCKRSLNSSANGPQALRWRAAGATGLEVAVPEIVDTALFCLL
jgi:hypothetical protein